MGWKEKAADKKKKAQNRKAPMRKVPTRKAQKSTGPSTENSPFSESELEKMLASMSEEKLKCLTPEEEEDDDNLCIDPDDYYMFASVGQIKVSKERMEQLHQENFERFKYLDDYGMFEEDWDELKQKYPDKYKGQYPPKLCLHRLAPWRRLDRDKFLPKPVAAVGSVSGSKIGNICAGCPSMELDAKPEIPKEMRESPTAASDSECSVNPRMHLLEL